MQRTQQFSRCSLNFVVKGVYSGLLSATASSTDMSNTTQIRFAPAVTSMRDYLEPHLKWLEKSVGCPYAETLTFEIDLPIGRLVIDDLLAGVPLDDKSEMHRFRPEVDRWEMAGG